MDPFFEENICYEQADNPEVFPVTIVENPSAERCELKGDFQFHVNSLNFALVDPKTNKARYIWPYRYIRRYGRSVTNFQFESGRKAPSGEGLFSLLTADGIGEQIFISVQQKFNEMKEKDRQFGVGMKSQKDGSQKGPSPTLPPRRYSSEHKKPTPKPKPSLKKSQAKSSDDPAGMFYDEVAVEEKSNGPKSPPAVPAPRKLAKPKTAAALNKLIKNNKNVFSQMDSDNMYDSLSDPNSAASVPCAVGIDGGEYGDLYATSKNKPSSSAPPFAAYEEAEATYDEIRS